MEIEMKISEAILKFKTYLQSESNSLSHARYLFSRTDRSSHANL